MLFPGRAPMIRTRNTFVVQKLEAGGGFDEPCAREGRDRTEQLRHSDARITLGLYGHVVGDQQRSADENRSTRIAEYGVN